MGEKRPYCLQCGSANVIPDYDPITSNFSIYCAVCGNRQYQGTDYVGFELREVNEMSQKGTCKNCGRPEMCLPEKGLCGTCLTVSRKYPDPGPARDKAMAEVKARIQAGKLQHGGGPAKRDPDGRTKKAADPQTLVHPSESAAEAVSAARIWDDADSLSSADKDLPPTAKVASRAGVVLHLVFHTPEDFKLFESFAAYCRCQRRAPVDQLMFMISEAVSPTIPGCIFHRSDGLPVAVIPVRSA